MALETSYSCELSATAINNIRVKGCLPETINGILNTETDITIQVGDWVQYNTTDDKWEIVETDDDVSAAQVGVVHGLKSYPSGQTHNEVNVGTADFSYAQIWITKGDAILAADTKLWNGSERVAFAPETHTSLAGKVVLLPFVSNDGSTETYYFSFH